MSNPFRTATLGLLPILAGAILGIASLGLLYPEELGAKDSSGGGSGQKRSWGQQPVDYPQYFARQKHPTEEVAILAVAAGLVF